jgi:hypothetical protein
MLSQLRFWSRKKHLFGKSHILQLGDWSRHRHLFGKTQKRNQHLLGKRLGQSAYRQGRRPVAPLKICRWCHS